MRGGFFRSGDLVALNAFDAENKTAQPGGSSCFRKQDRLINLSFGKTHRGKESFISYHPVSFVNWILLANTCFNNYLFSIFRVLKKTRYG
jgi:hypothetical protein